MSDLTERLRMKADMISLGERIVWGSDTGLMLEAAERIAELEREHNFSHEIAGCTSDNCKASGFECPAAKGASDE